MTNREITALALKVFALYVMVHALLAIPTVVSAFVWADGIFMETDGGRVASAMWFLGAGVVALVAAVVLALGLWWLARRLVSRVEDVPVTDSRSNALNIESVVMAALGLYLTVTALVILGYLGPSLYLGEISGLDTETPAYDLAKVLAYSAQALIGLSLALRPCGWLKLLSRAQSNR